MLSFMFQGGLTVPETERVKFDNTTTNIILMNKKAERNDAGKYSVLLTNEKGTDSATVNVIVVGMNFNIILLSFTILNQL